MLFFPFFLSGLKPRSSFTLKADSPGDQPLLTSSFPPNKWMDEWSYTLEEGVASSSLLALERKFVPAHRRKERENKWIATTMKSS